jgi:hypothetical protein
MSIFYVKNKLNSYENELNPFSNELNSFENELNSFENEFFKESETMKFSIILNVLKT